MSLFTEAGLMPEIVQAIEELGFTKPTPIQEKTIPVLINSENDILALAQTGTGKTAAFGLPIIHRIDKHKKGVQALVLSPTRELCMQITKDLDNYSSKLKNFNTLAVYGGASITNQIHDLKKGVQIVVGTPGRTLDMIKRKALDISKIQWLVLDEADEMLNMGFQEDLDAILETSPPDKKVLLFSATMPSEIQRIANKYMKEPMEISVGKRNQGAENVKHEFYMVHARDRYAALKRIADIYPNIYGIVFCRTRMETKEVADKLISDGYNADSLHGDLSQAQRDQVMNRFRTKNLQLLVATDVAARGLDVNNLSHVINYNLPDDLEAYVHRSGRTGRAGKNGISVSIIHTRDARKIKDLQRMVGKEFTRKDVPGGREICEKQLFNLIDKVENIEVNNDQIEEYLPGIYKKLNWLSREELIKHFVSVEFNRFLSYYENAPDLNIHHDEKHQKSSKGREAKKSGASSFSRFFINIGSKDNVNVSTLLGYINRNLRGKKIEIGKVEIMKKFSFFEIDKDFENEILKTFRNADFDGREILVELSKPAPEGSKRNFYHEDGLKNSRSEEFGRTGNAGKRRKKNEAQEDRKKKKDGDSNKKFKSNRKSSGK